MIRTIILICSLACGLWATDQIAANCTTTEVQAKANLLANGDRLVLPVCNVTWATSVSIPVGVTGFTIIGAGQTSTILNGSTSVTSLFTINPTSAGVVRITNLGFGGTLNQSTGLGFIVLDGVYTSFRIDHITATSLGHRMVEIGYNNFVNNLQFTPIYGLIDNITYSSDSTCGGVHGFGIYWGGQLINWTAADNFGSANAVYIEDSTLDFSPGNVSSECLPMDTEAGGRVVIRHNTIKDGQFNVHDFQNGPSLGSRIQEWYANIFQCLTHFDCGASAIQFRGGPTIAFDNDIPQCNQGSACTTVPRGYEDATAVEIWRVDTYQINIVQAVDFQAKITAEVQAKVCSDLRPHCDGGANLWCGEFESVGAACSIGVGTCRNAPTGTAGTQGSCGSGNIVLDWVDGLGAPTSVGYPAINQTGRGQYNSASTPRNALSPVYMWNTRDPVNSNAQWTTINVPVIDQPFFKPNRDYFVTDSVGCAAAGASCTKGVGRGVSGQKPANCSNADFPGSYPGPAYFGTDTNILYVCTGVNTWSSTYYAPYTYPHPLQNVGVVPAGITGIIMLVTGR